MAGNHCTILAVLFLQLPLLLALSLRSLSLSLSPVPISQTVTATLSQSGNSSHATVSRRKVVSSPPPFDIYCAASRLPSQKQGCY
jgi:hypothetical protein